VGKTQLTLEFTRYLFGGNEVYRFDMSEFLHLDNVKLFMGDETGNTGRLGNVLSQHQQGVLLFDEIEKAKEAEQWRAPNIVGWFLEPWNLIEAARRLEGVPR
jgi:ATP-dependent Clp protease ATP-binding subunit ClpA